MSFYSRFLTFSVAILFRHSSARRSSLWRKRAERWRTFAQAEGGRTPADFYSGRRPKNTDGLFNFSCQATTHLMAKYVYILASLSRPNMIYTGKTSDPHRRLTEHNSGKSFHTQKYLLFLFCYCYYLFLDSLWLVCSTK